MTHSPDRTPPWTPPEPKFRGRSHPKDSRSRYPAYIQVTGQEEPLPEGPDNDGSRHPGVTFYGLPPKRTVVPSTTGTRSRTYQVDTVGGTTSPRESGVSSRFLPSLGY